MGVVVWFDITGLLGLCHLLNLCENAKCCRAEGWLIYVVFLESMQK